MAAFKLNLHQKDNVVFSITLDEIDSELRHRQDSHETAKLAGEQQENESELQWLRRVLPKEYGSYADVFSKEASNVLPPHRSYDHKVQIDDPKGSESLGYSPLRHQSTQELQEVKRFLEENLYKGFIKPSQVLFVSLVLFVKKPNGGLWFYVDYHKLNNLIKKDWYLLPLINKTLVHLSRAKVYTKLDIRQVFY